MKKLMMMILITVPQLWVHAGSVEVGTAFTYQGELIDNGSPANGVYDLSIMLFNVESGGSQLDELLLNDISITNGLLNTTLDFGDAPFNGDELYLDISIRPGGSSDPFETLSPRQRINATPYAIQAEFVDNGASLWVESGADISYEIGNVGIGDSASSSAKLFVEAGAGESPVRFRIDGNTKLRVQDNGGTSIGTNSTTPVDGLYIQGDANQQLSAYGIVKAGAVIECGAGITGNSQRFFNSVNGNDFVTTQNGAAGGCTITVPFDISNSFFNISAHAQGGVNVFETVVASCSASTSTQIQCQLHQISGANTSLINGVIQIAIF